MYNRKFFILIPLISIFLCLGAWNPASAGQKTGKNDNQGASLGLKTGVQKDESSSGPPPIAKISEKDFKFSPIVEGTMVHHDFIIKNEGKATLNISKVKTG